MEIVERDVTLECALPPVVPGGQNPTCGFPKPPSLQEKASDRAVRSRVSLFAHHSRLARSRNNTVNPAQQPSDGSCMVDGSGLGSTAEAAQIHRQNQLALSGMTQLQILESRQQLIDSLQPQLVDFVRRRRLQQSTSSRCGGADSSSHGREPSIVEDPDGDICVVPSESAQHAFRFTAAGRVAAHPDGDSSRAAGVEQLTAVSAPRPSTDPHTVAMVTGTSSSASIDGGDAAPIDGVDVAPLGGVDVAPIDGVDAAPIGSVDAAPVDCVEVASIDGVDAVPIDGVDAAPIDGVDVASTATLDELRHQLPIDVEAAARRWPRMDRVEVEKLRWMTQLPAPRPAQSDTGLPARFHFDGDLLSVSADLPCESALYHHGQEPERAGYTVDEMFVLIRSSVQQQRIVGLQIITNLLIKTKLGTFDSCFSPPLLLQLLDSGLLLLLRFSMDDRSPAVVGAAGLALCALVHNRPDEVCLDRVFGWYRGRIQPALPSCLDPAQCEQFNEERHQLKDDHVARLDAIRALVRTDTLFRIRYILEVLRPGAAAVIGCLQLLTTFCRHSEQLAAELLDCPRLLDVLITEFLPPTQRISSSDDGCVYGVALHQLLKLLRILCSQSRQLTDELLARHSDLMCRVMTYTSIDPSDSGLPVSESLTLAIESYRLWTVLLSYNIADSHFIDFYPLLMRQLHYYAGCVSVCTSGTEYRFCHDLGTCVLNLCTTAVHAAGTQQPSASHKDRESEIGWHHVTGLVDPVMTCLRKWMTELRTGNTPPTDSGHQLLAAALCFLAAFHQLNVSEDRQLRQQHISVLCRDTLLPSIQSAALQRLLYVLPQHSAILSVPVAPVTARRDPDSLRSLTWGHALSVTSLRPGTPLPLLTGLVRLLSVASDISPSAAKQACAELLSSSCLLSYLRQLDSCKQLQLGSWFSRYELYLVTDFILMAAAQHRVDGISGDPSIFYRCAVSLLPCIPAGDEHLAQRMLQDVIFNPHLLPTGSVPVCWSRCAALYGECLWSPDVLYGSRVYGDLVTCAVTSLTRADPEHSCVPLDWWYAPLVHLYQVHNSCESAESGPQKRSLLSPRSFSPTEIILSCIRTLLTLHEHSAASLHSVSRTSHLSRLCCVFLAGDDLFLDDDVRSTLNTALRLVVGFEFDEQQKMPLDLSQPVPGLTNFHELYTQLLEQFEAVSYGDWLFGSVILLVLHPRSPAQLRRTLVLEKPHALRSITTSVQQMLEPLSGFVGCRETDVDIISAYNRALQNNLIVEKRNPALYQIATLMMQ